MVVTLTLIYNIYKLAFSPFCPPGHSEEKAKTLFFGLNLLTSFKVIFPSYLGCVSLLSFCTYFYFVAIVHRHYLLITRKSFWPPVDVYRRDPTVFPTET